MPDSTSQFAGLVRALAVATLVVAVVASFERAVSQIYLLNFTTAGPNATAGLVLLLATAWTVPVADAFDDRRGQLLAAGGVAIPGLLGVALVAPPMVAAVAALAVGLVALPLLAVSLVDAPSSVAPGAAVGLLVVLAARAALSGAPLYATTTGRVVLFTAGIGAAALSVLFVLLVRDGGVPTLDADVAPVALFLFVEATVLSAPGAVATWRLYSPTVTTAAAAVGLGVSGAFVAVRGAPSHRTVPVLALGFLVAMADLLWLGRSAGVALGVVQAFAVGLLARGAVDGRDSRWRWRLALAWQVAAVLLLFLFVRSLNWAYMPAPVDSLTHGRGGLFLWLVTATFPAAVLTVLLGESPLGDEVPDPDRRTTLANVGGAVVGMGALAVPEYTGSAGPAEDPSSTDAETLTVATYNVHQYLAGHRGEYNLSDVADVLRETGAGVVGLQESGGMRITSGNVDGVRWLAEELGYHADHGAPTADASYGVALLSAWPIRDSTVVSLPTFDSPRRLAMRATVETPAGDVPVVVTHLQTQQGGTPEAVAMQGEEAERVVDLVGDDPRSVVLGDCNVEPGDDPAYRVLSDAFTDAWAASRGDGTGDGAGGTWPAADPTKRIDYVWTGADWSVTDATVHGDGRASDHRAVSATLDRGV
ncbi:endonuclease/exonuclease/phosphatase family protein [Haloarchaeobius sp. HRN-SO-5]|uniref:endonuclease/exonuclease/phosphatase family protein n=1 Tax=Haloarchaeobius sp. HRN-SO-5 TaxID=3446118 RepID=UPI003EBC1D87